MEKRKGQAAVIFAVVLVGMLGFVALGIDGGMVLTEQSRSQTSTDAMSLTAAQTLVENGFNVSAAENAGLSQAANNGYDNNGSDNTVEVDITGPFNESGATVYYVNSKIQSNVETTFAQLFVQDDLQQTTDAEVRVQIISGSGPFFDGFGLIALDSSQSYPLKFSGSGAIYSDGANVYSASGIRVPGNTRIYTEGGNILVEDEFRFNGSGAFDTDGGDVVVMGDFDHGHGTSYLDGGSIYVDGNVPGYEGSIYAGGGGIFTNGDIDLTWSGHMYEMTFVNAAGSINPPSQWFHTPDYIQWATPQEGLPPITISPTQPSVPNFPKPDCSDLPNYGNFNGSSYLDETIYPGNYTKIRKSGSGTLTLSPGLYCVDGTVQFQGGSTVIADGVLFYVEGGQFRVGGGNNFQQTAPDGLFDASGNDWTGMAVYLDPDTNTSLTVDGGAQASYSGTIFAPESDCNWNGGVQPILNETQLVCGDIDITGGVTVSLQYNEDAVYQGSSGTPVISVEILD